jgi:predicted dehydrogenase
MRVAIIGARRVRQGLGPYLAKFVAEAGATLCAVVGTSQDSADEAATELESHVGTRPAATTDIEGVLRAGAEALVIASPHEAHQAWLEHAIQADLHVLCEKPLVWGSNDPAGDAERIASAFLARRLHLHVNAQWPWTLSSYRELCPQAPAVPQQFSMRMPPRLQGLPALLDTLSHPLSMLAALAPDPDAHLSRIRVWHPGDSPEHLEATFIYEGAGHTIETRVILDSSPDERRTTEYALDGHWARRVVDPQRYAMTLQSADGRIPLPDPTPRLVRSFVDAVAAGPSTGIDPAAVPGMRHLAQIMAVATAELGESYP